MLLFDDTFSDTSSSSQKPLYDFADYINGTSFKKNEYSDKGLPIIKIAELKNGITDSTQYFSGDKDAKYNVSNGDILFSWSGNPETSIDIFVWHLGPAILNQHTFNVKAYNNHKWFVYLMLKSFKPTFTRIASNKQTTGLGHVTASDLKRLTFPYDEDIISNFETMVAPMMEQCYLNMIECTQLSNVRDALLPRLMSGELDVSNIDL